MHKKILAITSFILCISAMIIAAQGYNPAYTIAAVAGSTPNIDGVIASGEWDDASTVLFNNTVVYVKHDGNNLYIAFNISDATVTPTPPQDIVAIFIDVENNGGSSPQSDDILFGISRSGTLMERKGDNPQGPPTGGWNASASSTSSYWRAEFNITYTKVQITPGQPKTLGIALESWNYEETSYPYFWPPMTPMQSNSPSNWGNLASEESWIPEFPPAIIMPIFMIITLLAATAYKRKHPPL
jgi:hypothetical protein